MGKKSEVKQILDYLHNHIQNVNNSKVFTGFMIVSLNIISKFVNIKMSKTMEAYLKVSFSKYLLIFIIAWMGTRDIYIAFTVMIFGIFIIDYLLNEESKFCILPAKFKEENLNISENFEVNDIPENITDTDITKAQNLLEKAKQQNKL
jgi:hypothetical protein